MPHCLSEIVMGLPDFGFMHLKVFIYLKKKKVEETSWMEASGSAVHLGESKPLACWRWMESSGQGFGVPRFSNHTFQRGGSAWWMIFIGERKLKEACHCSHSLVFVRTMVAPAFILVTLKTLALIVEWYVKAELSSDSGILAIFCTWWSGVSPDDWKNSDCWLNVAIS